MRLDAWEARYWHASHIILEKMGASLDDWLGASQAAAPRAIIQHAVEANRQAVVVRRERAKEEFDARKKAEKEKALKDADGRQAFYYKDIFTYPWDHEWSCTCPSCNGKAIMAGTQDDEEVVDQFDDEDGVWEKVETYYYAEQFRCPVCGFFLDSYEEIEYAELDPEHSVVTEREMEYEPDYGND